jgi:hypothetical protein
MRRYAFASGSLLNLFRPDEDNFGGVQVFRGVSICHQMPSLPKLADYNAVLLRGQRAGFPPLNSSLSANMAPSRSTIAWRKMKYFPKGVLKSTRPRKLVRGISTMTLDREKLQQTLAELHAQLDEAESLDADLADQLRAAAGDIERTLDKQQPAGETDAASTPEILEEAAVQFEQSHPTIAGTVRRLIDVLAQMGI